jgi:hypothetical protein
MSTNSNYIDAQLFTVAPLPLEEANYPYGFDVQISQQGRKTNHLRITAEQMRKIENVLRGIE